MTDETNYTTNEDIKKDAKNPTKEDEPVLSGPDMEGFRRRATVSLIVEESSQTLGGSGRRPTLNKSQLEQLLAEPSGEALEDLEGEDKEVEPEEEKTTNKTRVELKLDHFRNVNNEFTVVAFVNSASGGHMGEQVYQDLVKLLGNEYVFDLSKCQKGQMPEDQLLPLALDPKVRVLACGGDGTMGWIESACDKVWSTVLGPDASVENSAYKHHLPLAIMPLGTGNDLSRTYHWGPHYNSRTMGKPIMMQRIANAVPSYLDRWRCVVVPDDSLDEDTKQWVPDMLGTTQIKPGVTESIFLKSGDQIMDQDLNSLEQKKDEAAKLDDSAIEKSVDDNGEVLDGILCNYLSIGYDARVAFAFHTDRKEHPENYTGVTNNKLKYAMKGITEGTKAPRLRGKLRVFVKQNGTALTELTVPKRCRAVALLNIPSYAGGTCVARNGERDDGLIDVVFMTTVWRFALISGISKLLPFIRYKLAAQTSRVCIKTYESLHCQVDGEPWTQSAATINVRYFGKSTVLEQTTESSCPWNCGKSSGA